MKHLLIFLGAFLFCSNLNAEGIKLELVETKHSTNDRSLLFAPTVIYDGNSLHFVSDIPLKNLQILIKDDAGEIIVAQEVALSSQQSYRYDIGSLNSGTYLLELDDGKNKYWGYFEVE